jgi:ADP-ribosylglycohydrolase
MERNMSDPRFDDSELPEKPDRTVSDRGDRFGLVVASAVFAGVVVLAVQGTLLSQSDWKHMRKKIDAAEAEAKLVKAKRILRAEKKKAKKLKGGKLERANVELALKTMEVGVEAVEKLRDAAEELEVKNPAPE